MSDAAGELPHGFHLLALAQRFLGLHQLTSTFRHPLFKSCVDVSQRLRSDLLVSISVLLPTQRNMTP